MEINRAPWIVIARVQNADLMMVTVWRDSQVERERQHQEQNTWHSSQGFASAQFSVG